jgi:hypothetical protein
MDHAAIHRIVAPGATRLGVVVVSLCALGVLLSQEAAPALSGAALAGLLACIVERVGRSSP